MAMGRPLTPLALSASARAQLESMAQSRSLPHGWVRRAEIVLWAAEGWPHEAVAGAVGVTRATVGKGRQRFLENGLNGLYDERRSGAPRSITDEQVAEVIYRTLKTKPKDQTQWSVRSMGAETGLTKDAVHRIGRSMVCSPTDTSPSSFPPILSWSTKYAPEHALVLCVDEKSPIQALERSQPLLPPGPGLRGRGYARLQAPWHHHSVCRPGRGHR
jgi:transposase